MEAQLQINFNPHRQENNPESQTTLELKRKEFTGQNKLLYQLLMNGTELTFYDAMVKYGISDIRRRSKDLTDNNGILLSKKFINGMRTKIWFMTPEQINTNGLGLAEGGLNSTTASEPTKLN